MESMDEPFDEIMARPPVNAQHQGKASFAEPAVISPDPSPTARSSRSLASGPPTIAFSAATPDRWSQYERDEKSLQKESQLASANAIASAAERAANREMLASRLETGSSDDDSPRKPSSSSARLSNSGPIFSPSEEKQGFASRSSRVGNWDEGNAVYSDPHRVRAEAMKVLEMADDRVSPYSFRKSKSAEQTMGSSRKRVPAALTGMTFSQQSKPVQPASHRSWEDRRWTIDDDDEEEEDEMVDIVKMEKRSRSSENGDTSGRNTWSSRYNIDHRLMALTGGISSTSELLESMDRKERQRMNKSARNMFRTSPHEVNRHPEPRVFGSGFTFRAKHVFQTPDVTPEREINLQSHRTVWMDVDLQADGKSLPHPLQANHSRGSVTLDVARKRRRVCIAVCVAAVFCAITLAVLGANSHKIAGSQDVIPATDTSNSVKFYVTADIPFTSGNEGKLVRDLQALSAGTDFIVHLGNIQNAFVTLCPQSSYTGAKAALAKSPVPAFVLPGPHDWSNCPHPSIAFNDWNKQLGKFEDNFQQNFGVNRQLGNDVNFSFVHKGVLFMGLHLVGGRIEDRKERSVRHAKNVQWVEEQIFRVKGEVDSIVIFANARPSQKQEDFFGAVLDDITSFGKPVLYVHADSGDGIGAKQYIPFGNVPNLVSVQIDKGSTNPPSRISYGGGNIPFSIGV